MAAKVGGYGDTHDANAEIQKLCDLVKLEVEGKTNNKYAEFKAVKYRSQIVNGTNYLIKIHVKADHYIHAKLYQKLPCNGGEVVVNGVQGNHKKDDPLVPF